MKQLFELWWDQGNGKNFRSFYKGHLSDDMRDYYQKEYIDGGNPKSRTDLTEWEREWNAQKRFAPARPSIPKIRAVQ